MFADRMSSCRELSHLDDNVSPPLSCCITLLFATTADLLLDQTATVFTCFRKGSGGAGIELAGGGNHGLSWGSSGADHCSGQSRYRCRLFYHTATREGVGLRAENFPLCPGLSESLVALMSPLAGRSPRPGWRKVGGVALQRKVSFSIPSRAS